MTVTELFIEAARRKGRQPFLVDDRHEISGDDAWRQASGFAAWLEGNCEAGAGVVFLCPASARHAVAWFGALIASRPVSGLHVREPPASLAATIDWLAPAVLVFDDATAALAAEAVDLASSTPTMVGLATAEAAEITFDEASSHDVFALATPAPNDVAAIILSSGTTGEPKGVVHTHHSLTQAAVHGRRHFHVSSADKSLLLYLQPSFAGWAVFVLPCATAGMTVRFGQSFDPARFLQQCQDHRITHAPLVPTTWRMTLAAGPEDYDLTSLDVAFVGGEAPTSDDVAQLTTRIAPTVSLSYVASETLTGSAVSGDARQLDEAGKTGSMGRPGHATEVRIVDPDGGVDHTAAAGEIGEILVRGPSNAAGYWKNPELTARRFVDGWWRSGDLGVLDADGDLWVQGRHDNVINTGGIKVHGEEVENALLAHPAVSSCAVVGQPDATYGRRIEAYVLPVGEPPAPDVLDRFLREDRALAGFKVPKAFHIVDELPTGATGKLYRRALIRDAD
ncbi:MAG: class I adenylate-forming enzyme family protein [Actinomycetota bacterium]